MMVGLAFRTFYLFIFIFIYKQEVWLQRQYLKLYLSKAQLEMSTQVWREPNTWSCRVPRSLQGLVTATNHIAVPLTAYYTHGIKEKHHQNSCTILSDTKGQPRKDRIKIHRNMLFLTFDISVWGESMETSGEKINFISKEWKVQHQESWWMTSENNFSLEYDTD